MKLNIENHFCPVCGYDLGIKLFNHEDDRLFFSPEITGEICPSCGCEFDCDLFPNEASYMENRIKWIKEGMKYTSSRLLERYPNSSNFKAPEHWNPIQQLKNIDINLMNPSVFQKYLKDVPDLEALLKMIKHKDEK